MDYKLLNNEKKINGQYNQGIDFLNSERYEDAIEFFTKLVQNDHNDYFAYFYRSRAYYNLQMYNEALEDMNNTILLHPKCDDNTTRILYHILLSSFANVTANESIIFEKGLDNISTSLYNRGLSYHYSNLHEKAIYEFSTLLSIIPNFTLGYFYRGTSYYMLGEYENAIEDLRKCVNFEPTSHYNLALAYVKCMKYNEAITHFSKSLSLNSADKYAFNNRGMAYRAIKEYSLAISDFNNALLIDSTYISAIFNRALCYADMDLHNAAIDDFTKCIQYKPIDHFYYFRSLSYSCLLNLDNAIKDINHAINLNNTKGEYYYCLGSYQMSQKNYVEAEKSYAKSIELNPNNSTAYAKRAECRQKSGKSTLQIMFDWWTAFKLSEYYTKFDLFCKKSSLSIL